MLFTAIEMENEVFWRSMTSARYADYISSRVEHLKRMSTTSAWMSAFSVSPEPDIAAVYKLMQKAVKYRSVHQREQFGKEKQGRQDDSDSD